MSDDRSAGLPPEGWFPDGEGNMRWWDGAQWTGHIQDPNALPTAGAAPSKGDRLKSLANRVIAVPEAPDGEYLWQGQSQTLTTVATKGRAVKGRYRLTHEFLYFERGTLRTDAQQVPIVEVEDVDVRQSMSQKARGVGDVLVKIRRPSGGELVVMESIPEPRAAQQIINDTARVARFAASTRQNTMRYELVSSGPLVPGQPPQMIEAAAVPNAVVADPIEQLRKLGELRDAGVVTNEEFEAKKTQILDRM